MEGTKEGAGPATSVLPDAGENGGRPSSRPPAARQTTPGGGMGMPELRERAGGWGGLSPLVRFEIFLGPNFFGGFGYVFSMSEVTVRIGYPQ